MSSPDPPFGKAASPSVLHPSVGAVTVTHPHAHPPPNGPQLRIVRHGDADSVTLMLYGEVDLASAPELKRELRDAESSRPRRIVLDLAGLEFIDSTGIHLLIDTQQRAESNGYRLVLVRLPAHAQRVFTLAGVTAQLTIE